MARTTTPTPKNKESQLNVAEIAKGQAALQAVALLDSQNAGLSNAQTDEVFASGVDIGRLEAMNFLITVSESAILGVYENVKKSKAYLHMRNPQSVHGEHFQDLEEFCKIKLGKSYARLRAIAGNRDAVGADAFEQASRIGLQQRDFNAIKALPAPDRELVRRAVEDASSREEVIDLLQELASNSAAAQSDLTNKVEEAQEEVLAKEQVIADKDKKINKLEAKLKVIQAHKPDERWLVLQQEATALMNDALGCLRGQMRMAFKAIREHANKHDETGCDLFMAGLLGQVQADVHALRDEFMLPDVSGAMDQEALAAIAGMEAMEAAEKQAKTGKAK
jgi:hypothetical protein